MHLFEQKIPLKKWGRDSKRNACRDSNSCPQTQTCTQAIWTGGLFSFLRQEYRSTHGTCMRVTRHTARPSMVIMCPKCLPAQVTQSYGKPCRFQRDTKNANSSKNGGYLVRNNASKRKKTGNRLIRSRRKKKFSARYARQTARNKPKPHRSCPDGLPLQKPSAFPQTARVRRDTIENRRNKITNIHTHMSIGGFHSCQNGT